MTQAELETLLLAAEEDNSNGNFANAEKLARKAIQHLAEHNTSAGEALHIRALLALAGSLWRRGLAKDALPIAEQALERSRAATGPRIRQLEAMALRNVGSVYWNLSQYAKALEYYENALVIDEELGNKQGVAADTHNIGLVYSYLSQYAKSLEYFEKALAIDAELGIKAGVAIATGNIGMVYHSLSQYEKALEFWEKALAIYEELGNKAGIAKCTNGIGLVYSYLSQYAKALEYFEKALAIDAELGIKAGVAIATGNIGMVYGQLSQYAKELDYYEKALAIDEELGNKAGEARHTGNIGGVYFFLSQYAKALEYCEKALAIREELDDKAGVANDTGNVGNVYFELAQYAKALEYFVKQQKLAEDIGDRRQVGYSLNNVGETLRKLGKNKEAMEHLQHSLHVMREEIKTGDTVAPALVNIGSILAEEGQTGEGIEKLEEGLRLAEKLGEKKFASEAHKELAAIYKKQGDAVKSLEHLEKHLALDKEIFSDDTRKRVEAFNFRVAIANKERDMELGRLRAEKAEQALRLKERDLANTASSLAAQTELLGNFRADLRKIVLRPDRYEPEDIIRQVKAKLKELPCEMIDFSKFEGQFATVHPEYRARLETTYPELTAQEVKVCMLMHVNLKSAAIARLMCISERTVEKHRLNIRRVLKLTGDQDLATALRAMEGK